MYQILLNNQDGQGDQVLYSDSESGLRRVLSPTGTTSIDSTPTFDFTILPDHPLYETITKFKSVVTVKRNERILFYGRVLGDSKDFYGQKQIACEGALSFLLDSVQAPLSETTETPAASFRRLINTHNSQMETFKRFTVGQITVDKASSSKKFKIESYQDTRGVIESQLIDEYKGYLRARYENGTLYIDWLKNFGRTNSQPIKMAVNLLDKNTEEVADDYYTVLLPIGNNKKDISSVNSGSKYLRDETSIAKYGVIIHPESFDAKTPETLLTKAQEAMQKRSGALPFSAKLKLVDMKLLGLDVDEIQIGDVMSNVEGFSESLTVAEISYDLFNPENDEYTLENQAAIDKRHSSEGGKGTLSSRVGGSGAINYERYVKQKDTIDEVIWNFGELTLDVVEAKFNIDKFKILTGDLDIDAEVPGDRYTVEQIGELQHFKSASFRLLPQEIAETVQEITGVRLDEDHKPIHSPDGDYSFTNDALAISTRVKRTSKELTSTVGAIGIQLDPDTGDPIKDSNGNYINVQVDGSGRPIIDEETGTYIPIDFPQGSVLSRVKQTEDAWVAEVRDRTNADSQLRGAIEVNADKVSLVVTQNDQGQNELNRAEVVAGINTGSGESYVRIHADQVDLGSYATVGRLEALEGSFNSLVSGTAYAGSISVNGTISGGTIIGSPYVQAQQIWLLDGEGDRSVRITNGVSAFGTVTSNNGQISIPYYTFAVPVGSQNPAGTINFNIADTAKYKSDVGIASLTKYGESNIESDYDDWMATALGTLNPNTYYLIQALPNSGSPEYIKFKTPASGVGTITGVSRQPDKADWYEMNDVEYTVYIQVSGSNVSNSPFKTSLTVNARTAFNHGWDYIDISNDNFIVLAGYGSSTASPSSSKPSYSISKSGTQVRPYIWMRRPNGKWYRGRQISISTGLSQYSGNLYVKTGSTYTVWPYAAYYDPND